MLYIDARTSGAAKETQVSFVSTLWFFSLHILPQIQLRSLYDTSSEISLFNACGILNVDLALAILSLVLAKEMYDMFGIFFL